MRTFRYLASVAMVVASVSNSWAGALVQSGADVRSLQGATSSQIAAGTEVGSGVRLINKAAKGDATLKFADGCTINLAPGQVFTVGEVSPCSFKAEPAGFESPPVGMPLIIGGVVVLGGAAGLALALTSKGSSNNQNWPIPTLSH